MCSWWSLSSRSQCHRNSSPCSCFCLRFCYNWGYKSMYCWSLACLAFVTRWASLVDPVGLVNPCSNCSRDSAPCTCLCNGFLSCSTSPSIVGSYRAASDPIAPRATRASANLAVFDVLWFPAAVAVCHFLPGMACCSILKKVNIHVYQMGRCVSTGKLQNVSH